MSISLNKSISTFLFVIALSVSGTATATTYNFAGSFWSVIDGGGHLGGIPTTFTGSVTFDPSQLDSFPSDPGLAWYIFGPGPFMTVDVHGFFTDTSGGLRIDILNTSIDSISVFGTNRSSVPVNSNILNPDLGNQGFVLNVGAINNSIFSNDSLANVFPSWNDIGSAGLVLRYREATSGDLIQLTGTLTSLTAVPEPSTWLLFGIGLIGLITVQRRQLH